MLLLVVQAEFDQRGRRVRHVAGDSVQQSRHRLVHTLPAGEHLAHPRTGDESALSPACRSPACT